MLFRCLLFYINILYHIFCTGKLPRTLYIQIDGGGENANVATLGICALLAARRVCGLERVVLTRLPRGHTHEDCDAQFGVIWRTMRNRSVLTPQEYKLLIETALNKTGTNIPARVVDLYAVPDYSDSILPCIDPKLSQ